MNYANYENQVIRFMALSQIGNLKKTNILDVGCGLGDFSYFLNRQVKDFDYLGIDVNSKMIEYAKLKYPENKFQPSDLDSLKNYRPDYVFASGIFNRRVKDHERFVHEMIKGMFGLCRQALAFNIMSIQADFMGKEQYYADPDALFKFCSTLSQRVVINHDYMPHDFTIYIYRNNKLQRIRL